MQGVFDSTRPVKTSIELSLPNEKLQFDSTEELQGYSQLKGRVTEFSIRMTQGVRKLSIPTVKAEADTEVWCAGAIEAVENVIRSNRVWYGWFIYWPLGTMQFLAAVGPWLVYWAYPPIKNAPAAVYLTWLVVLVLLTVITFPSNKLLPPAAITFSNELGFFRRYGTEIGLLLGVISIVLSVISLL